jgi:undecaprenyl diphosphate synthase
LENKEKEFKTESNKTFVLAINYGGQDEILRAVKKMNKHNMEITKENMEKYLDFN